MKLEIPLVPIGALAPGSAHARPSSGNFSAQEKNLKYRPPARAKRTA
jgi:hypothetical protein